MTDKKIHSIVTYEQQFKNEWLFSPKMKGMSTWLEN